MSSAAAVITAAGSGSRMGQKQKKQYLTVDGIPVISKALAAFWESGCFQHFVITTPKSEIDYINELLSSSLNFYDPRAIILIEGAESRQGSVYLALQALVQFAPDFVLIHDVARPWVTRDLIKKILEMTKVHGACIPVTDMPDAPKKLNDRDFIEEHCDKKTTKGAQTPQGFLFSRILEAHRLAEETRFHCADDAEIYAWRGHAVFTIPGDPQNRKITYAWDMENRCK